MAAVLSGQQDAIREITPYALSALVGGIMGHTLHKSARTITAAVTCTVLVIQACIK